MLKRPLPQLTGSTGWWGVPFAAKAASLPSSGDPWKLKAVDLSKSFFVGFVCLLGKKRKVPFSHKLRPHARTHAHTPMPWSRASLQLGNTVLSLPIQ